MHSQAASLAIARARKVKGERPDRQSFERLGPSGLVPVERELALASRPRVQRQRLAGLQLHTQAESVKIIAAKRCHENAANLLVVAGNLEFFRGPADGEVVDENLALIEGSLRDACKLSKFEITQVLHSDPYADSQNRKHQSQRTAGRPKQE